MTDRLLYPNPARKDITENSGNAGADTASLNTYTLSPSGAVTPTSSVRIEDDTGLEYPPEPIIQFTGPVTISDDPTNHRTVVAVAAMALPSAEVFASNNFTTCWVADQSVGDYVITPGVGISGTLAANLAAVYICGPNSTDITLTVFTEATAGFGTHTSNQCGLGPMIGRVSPNTFLGGILQDQTGAGAGPLIAIYKCVGGVITILTAFTYNTSGIAPWATLAKEGNVITLSAFSGDPQVPGTLLLDRIAVTLAGTDVSTFSAPGYCGVATLNAGSATPGPISMLRFST